MFTFLHFICLIICPHFIFHEYMLTTIWSVKLTHPSDYKAMLNSQATKRIAFDSNSLIRSLFSCTCVHSFPNAVTSLPRH